MMMRRVLLAGPARTAIGDLNGALAGVSAVVLGQVSSTESLKRAGMAPSDIDEVIVGNVLQAGQGQNPARQISMGVGVPQDVPSFTVNKVCGSGMKAVMLANDLIASGSADTVIGGGQESMSNAPFLLPKARGGYRLGHGDVVDHMFLDGLEDAYEPGRLMGTFAEDCADRYVFSREDQDDFAIESLTRAKEAIESGAFQNEVVPVTVSDRTGDHLVDFDEQPLKGNVENIPRLKPAFRKDGTVTAANSSSISDGAAALVLMRLSAAERGGHVPLAKIVGHASHAQEPALFTTAPVLAIRKLLEKLNWKVADVDLYEINEAFAVVTMAAMRDLELDPQAVNRHGGACALGHPIGASGARIIVTLLSALQRYDMHKGIAALCIGGGEATAMAFERLN